MCASGGSPGQGMSGSTASYDPSGAFNTAYGMGPKTGFTPSVTGGRPGPTGFNPQLESGGFNPSGYSLGGGFPGWGGGFDYAPGVQNPLPHQIFDGTQPGTPPGTPPPGGPPGGPMPPTLPGNPGVDPGFGRTDFNRPPVFGGGPMPPRGIPLPPTTGGMPPPGSPPVDTRGGGMGGVPKGLLTPAPGSNDALMQAVLTGQGGGAFTPAQLNRYGPPAGGGANWAQTLQYSNDNAARLYRQGPQYRPGGMFYNAAIDGP